MYTHSGGEKGKRLLKNKWYITLLLSFPHILCIKRSDADKVLKIWGFRLTWEISSERTVVLSESPTSQSVRLVGPGEVLVPRGAVTYLSEHTALSKPQLHRTGLCKLIWGTAIHSLEMEKMPSFKKLYLKKIIKKVWFYLYLTGMIHGRKYNQKTKN